MKETQPSLLTLLLRFVRSTGTFELPLALISAAVARACFCVQTTFHKNVLLNYGLAGSELVSGHNSLYADGKPDQRTNGVSVSHRLQPNFCTPILKDELS